MDYPFTEDQLKAVFLLTIVAQFGVFQQAVILYDESVFLLLLPTLGFHISYCKMSIIAAATNISQLAR